jgi:CRP-like cAMP-binding protein
MASLKWNLGQTGATNDSELPQEFDDSISRQAVVSTALLSIFRGKFCDLILPRRETTTFKKDELIYNMGDEGRSLFFLQNGFVKVGAITADGREVIYDVRRGGDVIGELCATEQTRPDRAVALEQTDAISVPFAEILELLLKKPELISMLIDVFCRALKEAYAQVNTLALDDTVHRLSRRTAQAWDRCRANQRCQVYGAQERPAIAGLEDVPAQSCRWHCRDGCVRGPDRLIPPPLWPADHGARPATNPVARRHSAPNGGMDRQPTDGGLWLGATPSLSDPRSRRLLRRHLRPTRSLAWHSRSSDLSTFTLAERICGAFDRLDPPGTAFDPKRNHRGIMMQPHVRWPFLPTSSARRYPSGNKATFH